MGSFSRSELCTPQELQNLLKYCSTHTLHLPCLNSHLALSCLILNFFLARSPVSVCLYVLYILLSMLLKLRFRTFQVTYLGPGESHEVISRSGSKIIVQATAGPVLGPPWQRPENGYLFDHYLRLNSLRLHL